MNKKTRALSKEEYEKIIETIQYGFIYNGIKVQPNPRIATAFAQPQTEGHYQRKWQIPFQYQRGKDKETQNFYHCTRGLHLLTKLCLGEWDKAYCQTV